MELIHADIRARVLTRLQVSTTDPAWTVPATSAINEGLRLFAFLTLCLENTREFVLTPGVKFYRMLAEGWTDWLVPLRVRLSNDTAGGVTSEFDNVEGDQGMFNEQGSSGLTRTSAPKLKPATMYQMAALNSSWITAEGTPGGYGCLGWDLLFLDRSPTQEGQQLLITYARSSIDLVADGDVPEIPDADHEALILYGTARMRANEGGQELQAANALLKGYLDAAAQRAAQVRARSLAQRYDRQPFELEDWDYSKMLNTRPGLVPNRKEDRWTGQP